MAAAQAAPAQAPAQAPAEAPAQAPAPAQARRPTPHQALDRALLPVRRALEEAQATDDERARVEDLVARAEQWAAELVEAEHHNQRPTAQARARRLELAARLLRGRLEALRAEAQAAEAQRAALAAETRRREAQALLERVTERRIDVDRPSAVATVRLPPPEAPPPTPATPPTTAPVPTSPPAPGGAP